MGGHGTLIPKYYQSFSGTDTVAFILMPGCSPVTIGSVTTVSYSMYRNKKPVINIGRTNINGVTRGSRIFAGTMIFTLINQHWLRELQEEIPWLSGYRELRVDELPLFDIMVISANEYGNAVSMYIYGIDFTDEAQTISVEDLFTENTFSFIARDISTFRSLNIFKETSLKASGGMGDPGKPKGRYYVLDDSGLSFEEVVERDYATRHETATEPAEKYYVLPRTLYFSSSRVLIGNDVAEIQELLNATKKYSLKVNGVFDSEMDSAVRTYQSDHGLDVDGIVNDRMYNMLKNGAGETPEKMAVVVNKYGAYIYDKPDYASSIVDTYPYRTHLAVRKYGMHDSSSGIPHAWYETPAGYIPGEDLYSSYYTGSVVEFPDIRAGDTGTYVTMVQSALASLYPSFTTITGVYDTATAEMVKKFQEEHGLVPSGIVDYATWAELESVTGTIKPSVSEDNFKMEYTKPPGRYDIHKEETVSALDIYKVSASCDNDINIKMTAVSYFGDGSCTSSETVTVKEKREFPFSMFSKAFIYDIKHGSFPDKVECIIYPFSKKPFKWTFSII